MGYAWAPQVTGLVRGEPKPGQRHRSNGLAILMECMEERASKSPTLDRSKSHRNAYWHRDGGPSGTATWDVMCKAADDYKLPVKLKNGKTATRGLRGDAVIGWAAILKPPPEMVAELGMTGKDVKRFCVDGFKALEKIEPRLFRMGNVEAIAGHIDEGTGHYHFVGTSKDKAGKYCGNLVDANLCIRINQEFPAIMRGLGWPIDDLDLTDWERMKTDEAYRKEREAKRKRQGVSVEQYAKQRAEAAGEVATRIITDAQDTAKATLEAADRDARAIRAQAVQDATKDAQAKLETLTGAILTAQWELGDITEFKHWKAQKDAQEAEERARREREAQEARAAEKRRQESERAKERERQAEQARKAAQAAQEATRPKTPEERYRDAQAAIWGVTASQAAPEPPEPPKKPEGLSPLERLKAKIQASVQDSKPDGPSYPGS